jgi:DNA-binding Lrp family transcriptional regulator
MKAHNGMRPQDVVILLKICTLQGNDWRFQDIAESLKISPSEVSESLQRSMQAGLVSESKRTVYTASFLDFLVSGLKYVFPALPGAVVRGIPTAHSAPPINESIAAGAENYVWPSGKGTLRGQSIEPLYKTVPDAVTEDKALYELLALADVIRIGRAREVNMAIAEFKKRLKGDDVCQRN